VPPPPPPVGLATAARTETDVPLKQVFPWEAKPRTVTRVFAGEDAPPAPQPQPGAREESVDDDLPRSVASSDGDSWASFASRDNKWDTDPAIRDYVLDLRRRKGQAPDALAAIPGALDEIPPVTPVPTRRTPPAWVADEAGEDDETEPEWDPEKKLEELRRLPPLFVQESVARETKDSDNPALEDKGIQAAVAGGTDDDEQAAVEGDQVDSVTPKISALGLSTRYKADTFRYKSADVDPKAKDEALRKRRITRGGSVDSAIGSGTDESESLRAESIEA